MDWYLEAKQLLKHQQCLSILFHTWKWISERIAQKYNNFLSFNIQNKMYILVQFSQHGITMWSHTYYYTENFMIPRNVLTMITMFLSTKILHGRA